MSENPTVARDYTALVRHRGKQFTIGDLSLSKIGGVDLPAAGLTGLIVGAPSAAFALMYWAAGVSHILAVAIGLCAVTTTYYVVLHHAHNRENSLRELLSTRADRRVFIRSALIISPLAALCGALYWLAHALTLWRGMIKTCGSGRACLPANMIPVVT